MASNQQLRQDMETKLEAASLKAKKMFAQIMLKFEGLQVGGVEGSTSIITSELKQKGPMAALSATNSSIQHTVAVLASLGSTRSLTKYSKL